MNQDWDWKRLIVEEIMITSRTMLLGVVLNTFQVEVDQLGRVILVPETIRRTMVITMS